MGEFAVGEEGGVGFGGLEGEGEATSCDCLCSVSQRLVLQLA